MKKKLLTVESEIPKPNLTLKQKVLEKWHNSRTQHDWGTQAFTAYQFLKDKGFRVPDNPLEHSGWSKLGNQLKTPIFNAFAVMQVEKEICLGILVGMSPDNAYLIVRMLVPTEPSKGQYVAVPRYGTQHTFYNLRHEDGSNMPITPNRYTLPYLNIKGELV